ncbi:class I SAM-dependent methyltransferase [Shimia abyssi]|uniref:Methyltransferase type 11 domain-containing protein n=1 Tax=Shimia abyssi TaxID=1662395 RepID=A0A2P8FC79_9RHOB|nr:class I SAM-dependent methyltransferase [Shimia abyssi]PSL19331.1 hypothetical protein CLV88_10643 [Shimia abyssi]
MLKYIKQIQKKRSIKRLSQEDAEQTFTRYYKRNKWGDKDSASGKGSNLEQTATLRQELPGFLEELGVTTLLDAPCGDFFWMSKLDLGQITYIGGDIVPDLVKANNERFGTKGREFRVMNLMETQLPKVDLIFCRDCLVHLCFSDIAAAIKNIKASGSTWLLTTTFPEVPNNDDILTGQWRRLDMCKPPFNFPAPDKVIDEKLTAEGTRNTDKSMGLWRIADLPELDLPN